MRIFVRKSLSPDALWDGMGATPPDLVVTFWSCEVTHSTCHLAVTNCMYEELREGSSC